MPMVKLVSGGCGDAGAEIFDVGGCCKSWKWRLRRPNVRDAKSGRAGLSRKSRCMMKESWSAVRVHNSNGSIGADRALETHCGGYHFQ